MSFPPTAEQQAILDASATGGSVAIRAAAGAGKTSTLRFIAEQDPGIRWLYLAYNKSVQREAEGSFPANVECRTAHSLAWRKFGFPMKQRLDGPRCTGRQAAIALGITRTATFASGARFNPVDQANLAIATVIKFTHTADRRIEAKHVPVPEGSDLGDSEHRSLAGLILPWAVRVWADLTARRGRLKPTPDVYLKQWALSDPVLAFDGILYDEAQDADGCVRGVVEAQTHCQLIAVGDSAQAIYGWRGAGDFLEAFDADHKLALTQSWRFGQAIADEANVWLGVIGTYMRVVGNPGRESSVGGCEPDAILCRTNAGTIEQLLAAHSAGTKVHLVGEGKEMLALARAAQQLQRGERPDYADLVGFKTWEQVVEYAEKDPTGSDLAVSVRMIENYTAEVVVEAIENICDLENADLVVSTAHKAKGLEWDHVRIGTDFKEPLEKETGNPLPIPKAEAMLAYVAVTRARVTLDNVGLAWVHSHLEALNPQTGGQ